MASLFPLLSLALFASIYFCMIKSLLAISRQPALARAKVTR